jgi:ribosomal protein S18 acetylase RimI-like enzyme
MIKYIALPNPSITMKHIYEARDIVDSTFAAGYFNNHLNEIQCAWVALDDDKVVGWAAISDCMLRCIAVHPDYRGQGIGRTLTGKRLKYLGDCDSVMSYAWVRPDGRCMSCKNLENFGFVFEKELDNHYSNTRMNCKYCGTDCNCVARLYSKRKEDA